MPFVQEEEKKEVRSPPNNLEKIAFILPHIPSYHEGMQFMVIFDSALDGFTA